MPRKRSIVVPPRFAGLTRHITEQIPAIRTLQLVKTIFFVEYEYLKHFGEPLTEVPIIRIDMGPVPANYDRLFQYMEDDGIVRTQHSGNSQRFFPNPKSSLQLDITSIELDTLQPVVRWIKAIVYTKPAEATRIIKEESYRTEPMRRYAKQEEVDGKKRIGGYVLKHPYFTQEDVEQLAPFRRAYRDHLKTANKYSAEDAMLDTQVYAGLHPYLEATNVHDTSERPT